MANSVFITYAHSSNAHKERVQELAQYLIENDVVVELDRFADPRRVGGWQKWVRKVFRESDHIIIIVNKEYMKVFNNDFEDYKDADRYKGINYEIQLILTDLYENYSDYSRYFCVFVSPKDKKFVPLELKDKTLNFDVSNDSDKDKLLSLLKSNTQKSGEIGREVDQISHIKEDYYPDFIDFINRKKDKNEIKGYLIGDGFDSSHVDCKKIIQVYGPPKIGKTLFVEKCLKEIKLDYCENYEINIINIAVEDGNAINDAPSDEYFKITSFIKKTLAGDVEKDDIYDFTALIDLTGSYNLIKIDGFENLFDQQKSYLSLYKLFLGVKKELRNRSFNNFDSDLSIIICGREKIKFNIVNENVGGLIYMPLEPLTRNDVEYAILGYLASKNKKKSLDIHKIIDAFWETTYGLPGAIKKLLSIIEKDNYLIYKLYDNKRLEGFERYIQEEIISENCLGHNPSDSVSYEEKCQLVRKLSVFRTIDLYLVKSSILNVASKDSKLSVRDSESILNKICFIGNDSEYMPNPSKYEIDKPIRKLLFSYYFQTFELKKEAHSFALKSLTNGIKNLLKKVVQFGGNTAQVTNSNYFHEYIWHSTQLAYWKNEKDWGWVNCLREEIKEFLLALDDNSTAMEILSTISRTYEANAKSGSVEELIEVFEKITNNISNIKSEFSLAENFPSELISGIRL